jgi:serine/threonine-protein kinase PknG
VNCTQTPGCPGTVEDGYCNQCGLAPPDAPAAVVDADALVGAASVPAAGAVSASASMSSPTGTVTRQRTPTVQTTTRERLGRGMVEIEPVPKPDPIAAVLADPSVAESKRFCAACGSPVGRGKDGKPGRTEGFCTKDGVPFSFTPKLADGDLVGGQYEVAGCLAHGGLGWIYLARDRRVDDKWVVLKGVLNTGDADAIQQAIAELRFLAAVDHPNIVKVINFAEYHGDGYIVMEYVGGRSLRQLLDERKAANGGEADPMPAALAIAYVLDILPAFAYLHRVGLAYCDFKPDNVIQTGATLKLIDLGAVYRMDDEESPIYGTKGFQAPEIGDTGPTVPSDLYTVGRTLAVLITAFRGYQSSAYEFALPAPDDVPLFAQYDSLYQLLERATARHPDDRFQTVDEMESQLLGVLREVVATETGESQPTTSTVFTNELRGDIDRPDVATLPALLVSSDDAGAGFLGALASITDTNELIELLARAPQRTVEVQLREARALIDVGRFAEADTALDTIAAGDPWEWRVQWCRGLGFLAAGHPTAAIEEFTSVYRALPGEIAPKLAIGIAAERDEQHSVAARWYDVVSRTDPTFTTAAFGLARCRMAVGDRTGAIAALRRVPETSIASVAARVAQVEALLDAEDQPVELADVVAAGSIVAELPARSEARARLTAEVLGAALVLVEEAGMPDDPPVVLGRTLDDHDVRLGLEEAYRALARRATDGADRIALVDRANLVRPRTLT